ncbi:MAG: cation-transporting P-type ATPase [Dermatophilaceae bacterium]|nr:cation-transporting P-type ATPase [Intrasporangiaceae bacterium]
MSTLVHGPVDDPHAVATEAVLERLQVDEDGLSDGEAARRRREAGPNRLPEPERDHPVIRFLRHFHDALIYVLIGAAVVTTILGHWIDTGVIVAVVVLNAVIGFIQEGQAENALQGLRSMLSSQARVQRDGEWRQVPADDLVPGDIVRLAAGDRVPADVRLLAATNLAIEEAALTGESVPTHKSPPRVDRDSQLGDRSPMAYSGTLVTAGTGVGVVTATGTHTEIGRISTMLSEVETLATPLTRQMNRFGVILSIAIVGLAVLLFAIGWFVRDYTLVEVTMAAIGFAVAAIPEGLPAILTITLARGVQLMARRNAITRRLDAVETLGSVTVICSDKTGTLTKNEMTVQRVVTAAGEYRVEGVGYAPHGRIIRQDDTGDATDVDPTELTALADVAGRCNDAQLRDESDRWRLVGEPTDGGLLSFALKAGFDASVGERVAELPFDSENKLMATLDRVDGGLTIHLKGAPDHILDRCAAQGTEGAPLDRAAWEQWTTELSGKGLRVLAGAVKAMPPDTDHVDMETIDDGGFRLLGLVGLLDPPRPEAVEAIAECQEAGIRVVMITGDHVGTGRAIADQMGIRVDRVVSGTEVDSADDDELREIVADADVFARTSPEHKLRIVTALQARGEVVSMTGDGVNDAPSLKRADVGVAMGIKGTEATKEASEIVLADDNFASIARAVREGRTIYDNLRKSVAFILPTNGAQGLVILGAVLVGAVLPLTPLQVLWVNMVVAVTLALALAFEPAEPGLMSRPPRDPRESLLDRAAVVRIIYVSLLLGGVATAVFALERAAGVELEVARTSALTTLVIAQAFYLLNMRFLATSSLRVELFTTNRVAWVSISVLIVLQLLFVYTPALQTVFDAAPLQPVHWLVAVGAGVVVFLLVEAEKALTRWWGGRAPVVTGA